MRASLTEGAVQVVAVNDPFIDLDYMVSQAICSRTPISLQQSNMLCDVIKNFFFFLMSYRFRHCFSLISFLLHLWFAR